jgi:hypothetical protein
MHFCTAGTRCQEHLKLEISAAVLALRHTARSVCRWPEPQPFHARCIALGSRGAQIVTERILLGPDKNLATG